MKFKKTISIVFSCMFATTSSNPLIYACENLKIIVKEIKGEKIMNSSQKAFEHLKNTEIIKTKRLTLSKPSDGDIKILAEYFLDEDINKNFTGGAVLNHDKDTLIKTFSNPEKNEVAFAIKNQENIIVGQAALVFIEKDNIMEIGGFIAKPFWGNEYIEEADFAVWLKLCEVSTDFTTCLSAANFNEKSQKAIKKGLKSLEKMGINYSVEEEFVNWTAEVIPIENDDENVNIKYLKNGTEVYQKTYSKNMVKWHVLKDNKLNIKSVNYKITT